MAERGVPEHEREGQVRGRQADRSARVGVRRITSTALLRLRAGDGYLVVER